MINRLLLLTVLTAGFATSASAATPLQLDQTYNTGYVGSTAILAGLPDMYFTLYSFPNNVSTPVVADPVPAAWVTVPGAQFISPTEDQTYPSATPTGDAPGVYDYDAQLSTNFLVPTSITVTGSFAGDNAVTLFINGAQVTAVAAPAYGSLTNFSYTFTLNNTGTHLTPIDFIVNNLDDTNGTVNPTGLIVSNLKASAAPEPATWLMLFGGAAAFLLVQRTRRVGNL